MIELALAIPAATWAAFLMAGVLLNLTPGSDVLFATASGLRGGPRAGTFAGIGVGLGGLWHVGLAAAGVSALLAAHPAAFTALRWAGAAYLLFLAWQAWRTVPAENGTEGAARPALAIRRGFVTNVLNPKVALFVLAFLPQFADPALGPVWRQIVIFGATFTLTGAIITAGYGALAGVAGRSLSRRLGFVNRLSALVFGGLAAKLVAE